MDIEPRDDAPYAYIRELLSRGCTEEEFATLRCPVCSAPASLRVHHTRPLAFVFCPLQTTHLAMHVGCLSRQPWWSKVPNVGWYDAQA
jgi:hypothetical protein